MDGTQQSLRSATYSAHTWANTPVPPMPTSSVALDAMPRSCKDRWRYEQTLPTDMLPAALQGLRVTGTFSAVSSVAL